MPQQQKAANVQQQQQQKVKCLAGGRRLETLVLERLALPEQVVEFKQFEELSKSYDIEQPFVPRTQVELLFDVYDGRKLRQPFGSMDDEQQLEQGPEEGGFAGANHAASVSPAPANVRRSSFQSQKRRPSSRFLEQPASEQIARARPFAPKRPTGPMSWCKVLFARRSLNCCLRPSDTQQELGLVSASSSINSLPGNAAAAAAAAKQAQLNSNWCSPLASVQALLASSPSDDLDTQELKAEAMRLLESALGASNAANRAHLDQWQANGAALEAAGPNSAFALESAQLESTGGAVSICLLDKRRCQTLRLAELAAGSGADFGPAPPSAQNGRLWALASARLVNLRRRLRQSSSSRLAAGLKVASERPAGDAARLLARHIEQLARKASSKLWSELAEGAEQSGPPRRKETKRTAAKECHRKLGNEQLEELVELVKGSLNQLIDAQLLLRNKLTLGLDQTSSLLTQQIRSAEYETLLRNNFNLLKIWQNLEETKRLVCFVSEPIRASLADLFAFNRQRLEWPPASHFESVQLNGNTLATTNENGSSSRQLLLVSPLASLDGIALKRGLLQILEALNFLHAICKLVHRNLTPRNILICQNDNWKLSGLEFALRFESTTISESASMMAHEFSQALCPMLGKSVASSQLAVSSNSSTSGQQHLSAAHQAGASGQLRRQRTLHQTKCQGFVELSKKCPLLQPDLDYLAPEILQSAKCSHKSDLFSFGLVLAQTYDLCRHRPPLACNASVQNYEAQLKKLDSKGKLQLARKMPSELRAPLIEMLDCEPNLRPSANHVLQLLKRPVEMCKTSEQSLKHLRNSLAYLDGRFQLAATSGQAPLGLNHDQQQLENGTVERRSQARPSYFKRVTSFAANRQPGGCLQTRNLLLLNQLVRAVDSLVGPANGQSRPGSCTGSGRPVFSVLRMQFEQTLETLKQVLRWSQQLGDQFGDSSSAGSILPRTLGELFGGGAEAGGLAATSTAPPVYCPADSRALLLIVALHRRLLEQVGAMRAELPPICRLAAGNQQQPLDRSLASTNHRLMADLEERLHLIVSRQSLGRLSEALADPLLKLDEFLLVFELISDLVSFLGQRCKLNYAQRGKQLLQELTPYAGCPTLSSSEEEEEEEEEEVPLALADFELAGEEAGGELASMHQQYAYESSAPSCRLNGQSMAMSNSRMLQQQQDTRNMQQHQFNHDNQSYNQQQQVSRPNSRQQQLFQVPTSINITAPSPMGSVRDISRASLASSTGTEGSLPGTGQHRSPAAFATIHSQQQAQDTERGASYHHIRQDQNQHLQMGAIKRHSHQDVTTLAGSTEYLVEQTRQLKLGGSPQQQQQQPMRQARQQERRSVAVTPKRQQAAVAANQDSDWLQSEGDEAAAPDERSRSKLIDELLKTINDDSFNEIIDFNNKLNATTKTATSELDLINAQRPKSAIGQISATSTQASGAENNQTRTRYASNASQQSDILSRPRTLNLNSSPTAQAQGANRSYQARGSVCVTGGGQGQQSSTFDNVIRRMSTNLVQNFTSKMSGNSTLGGDNQNVIESTSSNNLRRERSNQSTYMNSLFVDTSQVPARRHSDNTINVPRIQVALSSPSSATSGSRNNLNQRASASASKLANKWKLTAKSGQRESTDKLSANLGGALGYMRRHSSGNTTNGNGSGNSSSKSDPQGQSNGGLGAHLLNASPFKQAKSSSNLGLDFLLSNRSMKRRCSAASMLGHQTQRKAEDLLDAGMKSVQNMFS